LQALSQGGASRPWLVGVLPAVPAHDCACPWLPLLPSRRAANPSTCLKQHLCGGGCWSARQGARSPAACCSAQWRLRTAVHARRAAEVAGPATNPRRRPARCALALHGVLWWQHRRSHRPAPAVFLNTPNPTSKPHTHSLARGAMIALVRRARPVLAVRTTHRAHRLCATADIHTRTSTGSSTSATAHVARCRRCARGRRAVRLVHAHPHVCP